jgi:MFS transporter, SP family, arabinose:H+ symporter
MHVTPAERPGSVDERLPLRPDGEPGGGGSALFVAVISLAAAAGGLLFGLETGVVSGTERFFVAEFALTAKMDGWLVGCVPIGCMIGAGLAGYLSDVFGRKKVLLVAAVLFFASAVWCGLSRTAMELMMARLMSGMGVGIASIISPLYIAEVSPPRIRGRLVALQQLAIVLGLLLAFMSNAILLKTDLADSAKWRWMFGVAAFPAAGFFMLLLPIPESPRWLVKRGLRERGRAVLARIAGEAEASAELAEIETAIASESGSIRELFQPGLRRALVIGVVLAVLQQVSGINSIMYYGPKIFEESGMGASGAFSGAVMVGVVNLVFTLLGMTLVDRIGRKALLIGGTLGMAIALVVAAGGFMSGRTGAWLLAPILAYVACFGASTGIVTWVIISEIFPTRVRGVAMSIAVVSLWAGCYVVSQTCPMLLKSIGPGKTFLCYASMCLATVIFAACQLSETKGRSLEEIESSWRPAKR